MAKPSALQWITKEAKRLRREYPRRFAKWTEYVAQASAIYASKHKGKSPVGHKHKTKKSTMPKKKHAHVRPKRRRRVGAAHEKVVTKRSASQTVTLGSVRHDAKRAKEKLDKIIGREYVKLISAKLKRQKHKISKKLTELRQQRRRLSI